MPFVPPSIRQRVAPLLPIVWRFSQVFFIACGFLGAWIAWATRDLSVQATATTAGQALLFLYLLLPVILLTLASLVFGQPRAARIARRTVIDALTLSGVVGALAGLLAYVIALAAISVLTGATEKTFVTVVQALTDVVGWYQYIGLVLVTGVTGFLAGLWFGRRPTTGRSAK